MSCKKCGHKLILGRVFVDYIIPDPEPYEPDQEVEIGDIPFNDFLDVHYCEGCEIIHDIWDGVVYECRCGGKMTPLKKRKLNFTQPRYDNVFYEGLEWLDKL